MSSSSRLNYYLLTVNAKLFLLQQLGEAQRKSEEVDAIKNHLRNELQNRKESLQKLHSTNLKLNCLRENFEFIKSNFINMIQSDNGFSGTLNSHKRVLSDDEICAMVSSVLDEYVDMKRGHFEELQECQNKLNELNEENETSLAKIDQADKAKQDQKETLTKLLYQLNMKKSEISKSEEKIKQIHQSIQQTETKLRALSEKHLKGQEIFKKAIMEISAIKTQDALIQAQLTKLKDEVQAKAKENDDLNREILIFRETIAVNTKSIQSLNKEASQFVKKEKDLKETFENLNQKFVTKSEELKVLTQKQNEMISAMKLKASFVTF